MKQLEAVRLFEGSPQPNLVDDFGQVKERTGNRGDRDAGFDVAFVGLQRRLVQQDPAPSVPSLSARHVNRRPSRPHQTPKGGGAAMTEHRLPAIGKDCGEPYAAHAEALRANRVDTAVDDMQLSQPKPGLNRAVADAEQRQLAPSNDPVLALGQ